MITRTRFAPSPTGALHSGTLRTALFAWVLARHNHGQFLLRIEDTDQKREVADAVDNIKATLRWLGLDWDEGPDIGGPYGPYVQSQRLDTYKAAAQDLVSRGLAYADPYSPDELQALREQAQAAKRPFLYREHRPTHPPTWDGSQALRIKLEPKSYSWDDAVMGHVAMGPEMIDDFIIIKADGFPTYNFCHIIDDHLMYISHVVRSQEFLSSIPKFLAAHEALGWQSPINVTVPQVMDETGQRKLSKRRGAKSVLEYRDMGILPEAMCNFLATIGWNDGTEQEVYTMQEIVEKFSLNRVQKSGGNFDEQRLLWLNGMHIRQLSVDELYGRCAGFWPESANAYDEGYKKTVLHLVFERLKFLGELPQLTDFFFAEPISNPSLLASNKQLALLSSSEQKEMLSQAITVLENSDFSETDLETRLRGLVDQLQTKPGILFSLIRAGITGSNAAPGLFETLHVIGKERSMSRLQALASSLAA